MSSQRSTPTPASPLRQRITKASYPLIARLHSMPKLTLPLITVVLVLLGGFTPPVIAVPALLVLALLLAWLGFLSWPVVSPASRMLRIFAVLVILFYAIYILAG